MSDGTAGEHPLDRALALYRAATVLMLVVIGGLALYAFLLGPLVGPGVEESFGLAAAIMFLAAALLIHMVDRMYRVWPGGRRLSPAAPALITDDTLARFLRILVVLAVGAAIAYVVATLVS